jgi:hypothetical protein
VTSPAVETLTRTADADLPLSSEPAGTLQATAVAEAKKPAPILDAELISAFLEKLSAFQPQTLDRLLPVLRIIGLSVLAGIGLKITAAVLGSINELPLLGRLLELVGLVSAVQFLSRNALQQQKRASLLARIEKIRTDLLG